MVKFYTIKNSFSFNWDTVTFAYLNRYPNPYATHVLSSDTLDHRFDFETGKLHITRLYEKTNSAPSWFKRFLKSSIAYIMEEITIDPKTQVLESTQRNITYTRVLLVQDSLKMVPSPSSLESDSEHPVTNVTIEGRLISKFGYGLGSRIEGFSATRIKDNFTKSREGLAYTINLLKENKFAFDRSRRAVYL